MFITSLRRDVTFSTSSFTEGSITIPASSSTITHRTTGFAPTLDFSYEAPISLANTRSEFAFGTRFGGYVTGDEREQEFSSRISTSGSWIINPYVQYRPRVANLWSVFFEGGAWIEDDCFFEGSRFSDIRTELHGFSAAPEIGIGASAPLPWANVWTPEVHFGLHYIGPSSISTTIPILGSPIDQNIKLKMAGRVAGEVGFGWNW